MNATEFHNLTRKLFTAGLQEGVQTRKMGLETMIGIIERNKVSLIFASEFPPQVIQPSAQEIEAIKNKIASAPIVLEGGK